MLWRVTDKIKDRIRDFAEEMQAETGLSVVEMILILVGILTPYYGVGIRCIE